MSSVNCGCKSEINYEIKKVNNKMKQQIINTRYGRRCIQRLSSVLQYIYKITNKQAGALKHSSQIFWRLIAIILMVAVTSSEFSAAIMPIIINKMDKLLYKQLIRFEILIPKNDDPRYDELLSELDKNLAKNLEAVQQTRIFLGNICLSKEN